MPDDAQLTIGEVANRAGLRPSSIRYYESIGVLREPERLAGRRCYSPQVLRELAVIDIAQRAGMSLVEIRELAEAVRGEASFAERLRGLAERKLPEIEALIARAETVSRWLEGATQCDCGTVDDCELFHEELLPSRESYPLRRVQPTTPGGWSWGLDWVWPKRRNYENVGIIGRSLS